MEDGGEGQESDYIHLDKIQTFLQNSPPEMHPHPLGPHLLPSSTYPSQQVESLQYVTPINDNAPSSAAQDYKEELPPAPPRTSSLRNNSFTSDKSIEAAIAFAVGGGLDGERINKDCGDKDGDTVTRPPVARPRRSKVHILPVAAPRRSITPPNKDHAREGEIPSSSPSHVTRDFERVNVGDERVGGREGDVTLMEAGEGEGATALVLSPPPEEVETGTTPTAPTSTTHDSIVSSKPTSYSGSNPALDEFNSASRESGSQNASPSNLSVMSSPSSSPLHHSQHPTSSHSNTSSPSHPVETSLDIGLRQSPMLGRASDLNETSIRRTHSNVGDSPIFRSKTPQSPVRRPSSEFVVLQPLSPEHGQHLNQQYEFLRRTLSHSQRRFSQRGRHPRDRKGRGNAGGEGSSEQGAQGGLGESGLVKNQVSPGTTNGGENLTKDTRQKQAIGQLKTITRESENEAPHGGGVRNGNLEEHVDQHGRTYYMNHLTRTIAFDRAGNSEAAPTQQDMQTRREMLDRRWALVFLYYNIIYYKNWLFGN